MKAKEKRDLFSEIFKNYEMKSDGTETPRKSELYGSGNNRSTIEVYKNGKLVGTFYSCYLCAEWLVATTGKDVKTSSVKDMIYRSIRTNKPWFGYSFVKVKD